jgi:hypothetical protein
MCRSRYEHARSFLPALQREQILHVGAGPEASGAGCLGARRAGFQSALLDCSPNRRALSSGAAVVVADLDASTLEGECGGSKLFLSLHDVRQHLAAAQPGVLGGGHSWTHRRRKRTGLDLFDPATF